MERDFAGKVVLITGGGRGLGQAAARIFASRGADLFLVDIREDLLAETRAELEKHGVKVRTHVTDIAQRDNCFKAVAAAIEAFGKLDVLCNIAGIVRFHRVPEIPEDEWQRLLAVNLSAPLYFSQAAIPHLLESHGNIVNVGSQAAQMGTAYIVAYSATKAAVVHLTRSMAMEYMKQPIRINAVCPGTMRTGIGEGVTRADDLDLELMARYQGFRPVNEPSEVAELIVFTASDRASAVHGAVLTADGGVTTG